MAAHVEAIDEITSSEATTHGWRVRVRARYSESHSAPQRGQWFFVYEICITNETGVTAKLLNRCWEITSATGQVQEVRGPGVIGQHPRLEAGQSFTYSSGCPLPTPFGNMRGTYEMADDHGERFEIEVAPFQLVQPNSLH